MIRGHVEVVRSIAATLDPTQGNCEFRRHRHAGVRIVLEGPSMIHALDLHQRHPEPLTSTDLLPFRDATPHITNSSRSNAGASCGEHAPQRNDLDFSTNSNPLQRLILA